LWDGSSRVPLPPPSRCTGTLPASCVA
jgi:hypothetical protein